MIPRSQRPPPQMRCGYLADTVDLQDTDEHSYMAGRPSCTCCRTARTTGLQVYIVTNMTHVAMLPRSCGRTYRFWLNRCRNLAVASCTVVTCLVCFTLAAAADSPDQQFRYELGLSTGYGGGAGWVRVAIASPLDPLWFSGGIGTWGGGGGGGPPKSPPNIYWSDWESFTSGMVPWTSPIATCRTSRHCWACYRTR